MLLVVELCERLHARTKRETQVVCRHHKNRVLDTGEQADSGVLHADAGGWMHGTPWGPGDRGIPCCVADSCELWLPPEPAVRLALVAEELFGYNPT